MVMVCCGYIPESDHTPRNACSNEANNKLKAIDKAHRNRVSRLDAELPERIAKKQDLRLELGVGYGLVERVREDERCGRREGNRLGLKETQKSLHSDVVT